MDKQKIQGYRGYPIPKENRQSDGDTCGCFSSIFSRRKQKPLRSNGIHGKPDQWQQQGFDTKTTAAYPRMPRLPQKPQDQYPATLRIASHPHGERRQWQQQRGANEKPNHYVLHESSRPTRRKAVRRLPGLRDTRLVEEAAVPGDISPLPEKDTTIGNPSTVTPPTTPIRRNRRAPRATEGLEANQPWQGWG